MGCSSVFVFNAYTLVCTDIRFNRILYSSCVLYFSIIFKCRSVNDRISRYDSMSFCLTVGKTTRHSAIVFATSSPAPPRLSDAVTAWLHAISAISLKLGFWWWAATLPLNDAKPSLRKTTADASGRRDIEICSERSGAQHEAGYERLVVDWKSYWY